MEEETDEFDTNDLSVKAETWYSKLTLADLLKKQIHLCFGQSLEIRTRNLGTLKIWNITSLGSS